MKNPAENLQKIREKTVSQENTAEENRGENPGAAGGQVKSLEVPRAATVTEQLLLWERMWRAFHDGFAVCDSYRGTSDNVWCQERFNVASG